MNASELHRLIVSGRSGFWAWPVRWLLRGCALCYKAAISLRNARYDRSGPARKLPVPVISVGNVTVGGTGKTPLVIDLVSRFRGLGFSPLVSSRGYGSTKDCANDEELLIRGRCPDVAYVASADRASASERAIRERHSDVVILDDGFQHRRLARDLDIVVVDATCPFGYGHLLPRGLLREPISGLRRAHAIVLSRCDQIGESELAAIRCKIEAVAPNIPVLRSKHVVKSVDRLDDRSFDRPLLEQKVLAFAGIGNPNSFLTTLCSLGVEVVAHHWWPDHHLYHRKDIEFLADSQRFPQYDIMLTTEKDAVKLGDLSNVNVDRIGVVKISIDFVDDDDRILQELIEQTCKPS